MPRQRMLPGEHGRLTERSSGGIFFASAYVRDADGRRRRVERSSAKSNEDARRVLQRHLAKRRAPLSGQAVTERTSLSELFELWIEAKELVDGVSEQTAQAYREVWRVHGAQQLGALRVTELPTSRANAHLQQMGSMTQAKRAADDLAGMYGLAVRYDVLTVVQHAPVAARGTPGRSVVDDSPLASADGGHRGPRCPWAGAGTAAALPREARDHRGPLPTATDPRP
jgi:hypothetical protein